MKKNYSLVGLLLVAAGALILLLRMFGIRVIELDTSDFWVFIVLLVGLSFEMGFFITGRKPGLLIPGGIITTISLLFMFEVATDWTFAEYTWPVYILSVAIGLFQMYIFSHREKGLLIASLITAAVALIFAVGIVISQITSNMAEMFIPISLIAAGIALFASGRAAKKSQY